jgi:glycosyltransferase involved in cell wall biosynthesis
MHKPVNEKRKHILITLPSLKDQGGVAGFYNSVLPYLSGEGFVISTLEIGSTRGAGRLLYPISDQLRFKRATSRLKPDLVHVNPSLGIKSFIRDGLFIYQAKRKRLPVIVFFRGWIKGFEQIVSKKLLWFFKLTYGQADCFIVLATDFKETLQKWGITQPIYLATTAVDESLVKGFSIFDKLKQLEKAREIKILFLARLEREKGVFETVDAISDLIRKGFPISLSIAGDGKILGELQQYVAEKRLAENSIRFLGYVKKGAKSAAFAQHHIYCLPTAYGEGLPNSILEAMAFGMPVVTRPVGGIADFFKDGRMGSLCQEKTADEIATSLEDLIVDRAKMIKMSKYNFDYAKEHFMASSVARNLVDIYQQTMV